VESSGLPDSTNAIGERIGPDAHYSLFEPPKVQREAARGQSLGRLLWIASAALLVVVLILAMLVALGF
jgi:hypothetical protein